MQGKYRLQLIYSHFIVMLDYIYVSIYGNSVKEFKRSFFFSPETVSKVDNIKIKSSNRRLVLKLA